LAVKENTRFGVITGLIADSFGIDISILAIGGLTILSTVVIEVKLE
jgi:hypothetical protein